MISVGIIKNKILVSFVVTFFAIGTICVLALSGFAPFLERINLGFSNFLYVNNEDVKENGSLKVMNDFPKLNFGNEIVIIEIDDKTLSSKSKGGLGKWQDFKRSNYAKVIDNIKADGANVVGLDMYLSEESDDLISDSKLQKSISNFNSVVLGFSNIDDSSFPLNNFLQYARNIGFFNVIISNNGEEIYRIDPAYTDSNGDKHESFSLAVARTYLENIYGKDEKEKKSNKYVYNFYGNINIPFSGKNTGGFMIKYVPEKEYFKKISFVDVYNNNFDKGFFKDKIVLIGATSYSLHDQVLTPLGIQSGVYVHANAINTVLKGKFIKYFDGAREGIFICLMIFFISFLGIYLRNRYLFIVAILSSFGYYILYKFMFIFFGRIFYYPVYFLIGVLVAVIGINIYKYIYENKGKKILKNTLGQYLSEEIVTRILDNYEEVKLSGEKKDITVFFSDIAGFTTISENLSPERLVEFLRHYLKEMSNIIIKNKGFINKYEGDAVMALWGTFEENSLDQIRLACRVALEQQEKLRELNDYYKETFGFDVQVRMGINYGDAIVGNIGSVGKKIEYTALGNNVNIASRLEGINKEYNTKICVSESIKDNTGDEFVFRKLDEIKLKGKNQKTTIYELVGLKGHVSDNIIDLIKNFEIGLEKYKKKDFKGAYEIFSNLCSIGDNPSCIFRDRCKYFLENGISDNWEGIWIASSK